MRLRPPTLADAAAVRAVLAARGIAHFGRPDLERDCFVAEDDGSIVGFASIEPHGALVVVHPQAEGRGIGTALREAVEARAAERCEPPRQIVQRADAASAAHLRAAGYERLYVHRRMRVELADAPPPSGAGVRTFDLDAEGPAVHALIAEAFDELEGSVAEPYAGWHETVARRSAPPLRLAIGDDDGLVAAAVGEVSDEGVGYVARLAVARRGRGRGHGRALLLALFEAFRAAGSAAAELSVAGTNAPATGLYESVGMRRAASQELWGRLP